MTYGRHLAGVFYGGFMDFLNDDVKKVYLKYLKAAFGSALITSIYSIVDTAVVGQCVGPLGTAALAIIAPVWNIIYSLGLLTGIGGAVIFSSIKGKNKEDKKANEYFTSAVIESIALSIIVWLIFILFKKNILIFFGADESLLELDLIYLKSILFILPLFLFNQMLAAFLRNDNNPSLATKAVLAGGLFNCFGDYFFVFILKMGIFGAGLATAIGCVISFVIMMFHFKSDHNTLKLVKVSNLLSKIKNITITGFSTFFIDVAMGILTILFNNQIMKYLGSDALAIYGPIINVSTFVQCCAYSVGQASQPLISTNFGAKQFPRIKEVLKYALCTSLFFVLFWTAISLAFPNVYIYIFMKPTESILEMAPSIIRTYSLSFIFLPINIFSTYYFGAIAKPKKAFVVSVFRGLILSGLLVYLLPMLFGKDFLFYTMPITELIVGIYALINIQTCTNNLERELI